MSEKRITAEFVEFNFVERLKHGYSEDPWFTPENTRLFQLENELWWSSQHKLVIPNSSTLRRECIESVHDHPYSGHFGQKKTYDLASRIFYWSSLKSDIEAYCRACPSCQVCKARNIKPAGLLQPFQIPRRRWESISMTFITGLQLSKAGNNAICVVCDRLSKMVYLLACSKRITASQFGTPVHKGSLAPPWTHDKHCIR